MIGKSWAWAPFGLSVVGILIYSYFNKNTDINQKWDQLLSCWYKYNDIEMTYLESENPGKTDL